MADPRSNNRHCPHRRSVEHWFGKGDRLLPTRSPPASARRKGSLRSRRTRSLNWRTDRWLYYFHTARVASVSIARCVRRLENVRTLGAAPTWLKANENGHDGARPSLGQWERGFQRITLDSLENWKGVACCLQRLWKCRRVSANLELFLISFLGVAASVR